MTSSYNTAVTLYSLLRYSYDTFDWSATFCPKANTCEVIILISRFMVDKKPLPACVTDPLRHCLYDDQPVHLQWVIQSIVTHTPVVTFICQTLHSFQGVYLLLYSLTCRNPFCVTFTSSSHAFECNISPSSHAFECNISPSAHAFECNISPSGHAFECNISPSSHAFECNISPSSHAFVIKFNLLLFSTCSPLDELHRIIYHLSTSILEQY